MLKELNVILEIQQLDIKMIRLLRLKQVRNKELTQIDSLRNDLKEQLRLKQEEIDGLSQEIKALEAKVEEINQKIKTLESQQSAVKKMDEFTALTHEMTAAEKERIQKDQELSNLVDKQINEQATLEKIQESLNSSEVSSQELEKEINESINLINEEGSVLKNTRDELVTKADPQIFAIYERLIKNRRDRVVVPIENRTCSGCHIALTAQHENLVRRAEKLVFCEHCSRILYWEEIQDDAKKTTRRRRKRTTA